MAGIILILSGELALLYLITRILTQQLYISAFMLTNSRPVSITIVSLIFFPGTVVHELAHLFVAEILGVRTSGLTLVPEGLDKTNVRTGSVSIARSDPIRRAIIGIAPVFVGIAALSVISFYIPVLFDQTVLDYQSESLFSSYAVYCLLLSLYSLFALSNSMFSSPEDMEGFWPVAITLGFLIAGGFFVGLRFPVPDSWILTLSDMGTSLARYLGYTVGLNVILLIVSKAIISIMERLTGRRFINKN